MENCRYKLIVIILDTTTNLIIETNKRELRAEANRKALQQPREEGGEGHQGDADCGDPRERQAEANAQERREN